MSTECGVCDDSQISEILEKFEKLSIMSDKNKHLVDEEKKLGLKINRFLDEYEFELLFDISDIENGILEFKVLLESFEGIHIELKNVLKDQYLVHYKHFPDKYNTMKNWVKLAKIEIKNRKEKIKMEEARVKKEEVDRLRKEE